MKDFLKASINRAIRTMAQTLIATIGTTTILSGVDWKLALSTSAIAGILSMLNSVATGLPECKGEEE